MPPTSIAATGRTGVTPMAGYQLEPTMKVTLEIECLDVPPNTASRDRIVSHIRQSLAIAFRDYTIHVNIVEEQNATVHSVDCEGSHRESRP